MIRALTKALLYNLWYREQLCADCTLTPTVATFALSCSVVLSVTERAGVRSRPVRPQRTKVFYTDSFQ